MQKVATTFAPVQALREPRRFDWRVAIGGFLLLAAFGGSVAFWSATSDVREVLVAARDVPAGAQLADGDLVTARVRVDDAMYRAAVPAGDRRLYVGRQLAQPLHAQQLVARAPLSAKPPLEPHQMALAVPVSAETAAGGKRPTSRVHARSLRGRRPSRPRRSRPPRRNARLAHYGRRHIRADSRRTLALDRWRSCGGAWATTWQVRQPS
jgi:hypothetical protein